MTAPSRDARTAAEAILAALKDNAQRDYDVWMNWVTTEVEKTPGDDEDFEAVHREAKFMHGQSVGSYWAHDAARRSYHAHFGD